LQRSDATFVCRYSKKLLFNESIPILISLYLVSTCYRPIDIQTDRQRDGRQADRQTKRQTERQKDKPIDNRQTNR